VRSLNSTSKYPPTSTYSHNLSIIILNSLCLIAPSAIL
jgi:hypothetical protein